MNSDIKIGVIGYGYWGPNIVRNFISTKGAKVVAICDNKPENLKRANALYPNIKCVPSSDEIFLSSDIDAVAIITPVGTHYDLVKKSLENGKHVFVEKPFTASLAEAGELIDIALRRKLKIMVDHTFIFTGAVKKIKEIVDDNTLGELCYYDSTRVNLGIFQHDVNVLWDLAPHDFAIMDYVLQKQPVAISATGIDHFNSGHENTAYLTAFFDDKFIAHFSVNWFSPVKIRTTLIGGQKKMLMWDDLQLNEKIKIYDKGVDIKTQEGIYQLLVDYRSGDMWAPRLETVEALRVEAQYFIDCIVNDKTPVNDGIAGLKVVRMLEASDRSLKQGGNLVKL